MSLNNIIYNDQVSDGWKKLRVASLTVDNTLNYTPSNVMSLDVIEGLLINSDDYSLQISGFEPFIDSPANIALTGITYVTDIIKVLSTGYYMIDIKLLFVIQTYNTSRNANIQLIFYDLTAAKNVAYDENYIPGDLPAVSAPSPGPYSKPFNVSINKLVKLIAGHNYNIIIKNNNDAATGFDPISIYDNGKASSYVSIVKLG